MLRRLSVTLKEQKDVKRAQREVRGAAVPYHEPTSTDDDDDDVDDDVDDDAQSLHRDVTSTSLRSWPSTPSTPSSLASSPPLELSARTLLWSGGAGSSVSSPPGSSPSSPVVHLPQSRAAADGGLQLVKQLSLAALAESGDVDGLKATLKLDASSINDTDEVRVR